MLRPAQAGHGAPAQALEAAAGDKPPPYDFVLFLRDAAPRRAPPLDFPPFLPMRE